tara:strand:+ start:892 stop:2625 length:1734 start_codon:yes stop_codon:yes gene_type:complete
MRLLNLNKFLYILLFLIISLSNTQSEEPVDIWKKDINNTKSKISIETEKFVIKKNNVLKTNIKKVAILEEEAIENNDRELLGIYDPQENNFNLDIWTQSSGEDIKNFFKRIDKIKLSKSAEDYFEQIIMTYSYLPKNISNEEFLNLKIDWLIKNNKDELLEDFLSKNSEFKNKKKVIQYLVDKNIAKANITEGCKKSGFISKEIKDSYLEKFKIYCLIFNDKKNEAQLVFDLLKEQKLSDKFFENKINYLLGISEENYEKVKEDSLLNFYLSSITVPNFNYEPNPKTNKYIWEYLNNANLIKVGDIKDKERIKKLETAANKNTLDKLKIFEIYKQLPFDINTLINAEGIYQSMDGLDARALIYQKSLLSDNIDSKINYLFLLKDLFKKDNLSNVYKKFLSDTLKELKKSEIPESYIEVVEKNIISDDEFKLGKIKYNDKILHRSRIIKHYTEKNNPTQKIQKDLNNIYKKIRKNKNYFFSAKDLALVESLELDGFIIPKEINLEELAKKYKVPEGFTKLIDNNEIGLLALKLVEIIGEDEINSLDAETIYFITHILNKSRLIKFRNKVLIAALPQRS